MTAFLSMSYFLPFVLFLLGLKILIGECLCFMLIGEWVRFVLIGRWVGFISMISSLLFVFNVQLGFRLFEFVV